MDFFTVLGVDCSTGFLPEVYTYELIISFSGSGEIAGCFLLSYRSWD